MKMMSRFLTHCTRYQPGIISFSYRNFISGLLCYNVETEKNISSAFISGHRLAVIWTYFH